MPIDKTKKNIFLLATCQALFMTSTSAVFTTSALVGHMLAEDKSFATLPLAIQFAAGMAVTVPASLYMKRFGRQIGFITGALIGMTGAVTATARTEQKGGTGGPVGSPRPCMKFANRRYATVASSSFFEAWPPPCAMAGWQNRIPISRRPVKSPSVKSG